MGQPPIIRSDDLRSENRHRILNTLRFNGSCSPTQLNQLTGLSPAAISTLCAQMIEQGILRSDKQPLKNQKSTRGRPSSMLSLNSGAGFIVTLNLTIDMIRTQRIDYAGNACHSVELALDTRELSSDALIQHAIQSIESVCPAELRDQLHHISVSFQGMTEHASGALLWSPIISVRDVPLGQTLENTFDVSVSVNNDCRVLSQALMAEHHQTLGNSFATIQFSNGIGLGLYLNGRPFSGTQSSALELGHLTFENNGALCRCGKRGCIEAYSAAYGIERMARGSSIQDIPSGRVSEEAIGQLVDEAKSGNEAAIQAFTIAGAAIGQGLASLFTLLDPMPVALVGCSQESFKLMRSGIESMLRRHTRQDVVTQTTLHCFSDQDPLFNSGLIHHGLSQVDRLLSDANYRSSKHRES